MHFTKNASKTNTTPIVIKGMEVSPKKEAKVLGVVLDPELWYKTHIANAAAKGLKAAMELKRLRLVSPRTARQLFSATVAPVADYALNVWSHTCTNKLMTQLERVQRIGATAITGSFRTVAMAIAEAEADIRPVRQRHAERAIKLLTNLPTLPKTKNFLVKVQRSSMSPLSIKSSSDSLNDISLIGRERPRCSLSELELDQKFSEIGVVVIGVVVLSSTERNSSNGSLTLISPVNLRLT
jgi:hypothetical protein